MLFKFAQGKPKIFILFIFVFILFFYSFIIIIDIQVSPGFYLYGGKTRNDNLAQKSVGHELKVKKYLLLFFFFSTFFIFIFIPIYFIF